MKKTSIRNFIVRSIAPVSSVLYREKPRIRILALHDISPDDRELFLKKMRWLARFSNVVSLRDAFERKGLDNALPNIAITFDDGFKCFSSLIAPALRELSLPATFFVPTGAVGISGQKADEFALKNLGRHGKFEFMTEADCIALSNDPLFEIGGHTQSHIDLGRKLSPEELFREIAEDKTTLEKMMGKPVVFLAYPFGGVKNVCDGSVRAIRDAGYKAAFTILPSFWKQGDDPFRIGRDSLSIHESDKLWYAWLSGGYDRASRLKKYLKRF